MNLNNSNIDDISFKFRKRYSKVISVKEGSKLRLRRASASDTSGYHSSVSKSSTLKNDNEQNQSSEKSPVLLRKISQQPQTVLPNKLDDEPLSFESDIGELEKITLSQSEGSPTYITVLNQRDDDKRMTTKISLRKKAKKIRNRFRNKKRQSVHKSSENWMLKIESVETDKKNKLGDIKMNCDERYSSEENEPTIPQNNNITKDQALTEKILYTFSHIIQKGFEPYEIKSALSKEEGLVGSLLLGKIASVMEQTYNDTSMNTEYKEIIDASLIHNTTILSEVSQLIEKKLTEDYASETHCGTQADYIDDLLSELTYESMNLKHMQNQLKKTLVSNMILFYQDQLTREFHNKMRKHRKHQIEEAIQSVIQDLARKYRTTERKVVKVLCITNNSRTSNCTSLHTPEIRKLLKKYMAKITKSNIYDEQLSTPLTKILINNIQKQVNRCLEDSIEPRQFNDSEEISEIVEEAFQETLMQRIAKYTQIDKDKINSENLILETCQYEIYLITSTFLEKEEEMKLQLSDSGIDFEKLRKFIEYRKIDEDVQYRSSLLKVHKSLCK